MPIAERREKERGRSHVWVRALLAGPCVVGLTVLIIAVMPSWVPKGNAGLDHIAFPLFFMPAVWAILFFYALLDRSLGRIAIIMTMTAIVHLIVLRAMMFG